MRKTHKEYLNEIMERVREREKNKEELREYLKALKETKEMNQKSDTKETVVKEPMVVGYLNSKPKTGKRDFYGVVTTPKNDKDIKKHNNTSNDIINEKEKNENDSEKLDDEIEEIF